MGTGLDYTPVTAMGDLLLRAAGLWPDRDAVVFDTWKITYAGLHDRAMARARELYGQGVRPGDHVGILLVTCPEYAEYYFGIAYLGAVAVPINARYRADELRYQTLNADLVHIVTTGLVAEGLDFRERIYSAFPALRDMPVDADIALEDAPRLRGISLLTDEAAAGFRRQSTAAAFAEGVDDAVITRIRRGVSVRAPALILYTSGTTSDPKGCVISHEALVRCGMAMADRYDMSQEDVFWAPLPLFHVAALVVISASFSVGASYVAMQHFNAGDAIRLIREKRVTMGYPSFALFLSDMVHHPDFRAADMETVRLINCSMALSPQNFRDKMKESFPNAVFVGTYGMTETAGPLTTSFPTDPEEERFNRLGRPFDGLAARIERADGTLADTGEIGEICVRGYSVFSEYYKDPAKTASSFRDGWFHTGDLGSIDAAGTLMFHGRQKDMLKVGGENVAALEIEITVAKHPAVKTCQVVGQPDDRLQEVPFAFVELVPGTTVDPKELIDYCKDRIASFKVPRGVHFVDEWPMSSSKIQKFKLREQLLAMIAARG